MELNPGYAARIHFHIRWSGVSRLDWEAFTTKEEAAARGKELARPNEHVTIVQCDETCSLCGPKAASAS